MNEELQIKLRVTIDEAKRNVKAVTSELGKLDKQTDATSKTQESLTNVVKKQKQELDNLKRLHEQIVSVHGAESTSAVRCASHIAALSSSYATNLAAVRASSANSLGYQAALHGVAAATDDSTDATRKSGKAFEDVEKQIKSYKSQLGELSRQYSDQESYVMGLCMELDHLEEEFGKNSTEAKKVEAEINSVTKSMSNVVDEVADVQKKLNDLNNEMNDVGQETSSIKKKLKEFGKAVKDSFKEARDEAKDMGNAWEDLNNATQEMGNKSKAVLKGFAATIAGVTVAALALVGTTKEYREQQAKLKTAFETAGGSAELAKKTYNDLYRVLGDSGQATEAAQHLAKLTTNEKELAQWTNITKGVYATFGESLPIESLTEAINHSAKLGEVQGSLADALEWSGISVDDFNEQLFWCNSESEREKLIRDTLNGLYSEAAENYEANNAQVLEQNEAQAKLNESLALVGEALSPVMIMLTELAAKILADLAPYIQEFADKYLPDIIDALSGVGEAIGKALIWIIDNWELVSTLAAIILGIAAALSVVSTVMGIVNAVMLASPVTWIVLGIVAAIAAVIAIVVLLIKYWDEVKEATRAVWEPMVNFFKSVLSSISGAFKEAWELIKVVWNAVKPFFRGIWSDIKAVFSVVKDVLGGFFKAAWQNVKINWEVATSFFRTLIDSIKLIFSAVKNILSGNFKAAWDDIKQIFSNWKSFFSGLWNSIKDIFANTGKAIGDAVSSTVKAAINGVLSAAVKTINGFISAINAAISVINVIPGVSISKLSKLSVPKLERGGVLKKGQVGLLEGNGAEAVVPLERTEWIDKIAEKLNARTGGDPVQIVLQVDGKTFAKTAVRSINDLTRQQGKLSINLV